MNATTAHTTQVTTEHTTTTDRVGSELLAKQQQAMSNAVAAQTAPTAQVAQLTNRVAMKEELELAGLGEELGRFKAYDSQLPIATIAGTRIVKCLYQMNPKTKTKAQENAYVRIPTVHLTEEHIVSRIAELTPYVLCWLQGIEEQLIKDSHKKGALTVYTEGLGIDKLVAHLEESSEGARLSKDKIDAWFTSTLEEGLTARFATKMNLDENSSELELERLELVLRAYRAKFSSLAGGKVHIKEEDCTAMVAVIASSEEAAASLLGVRFTARLEKMKTSTDDLLLSL